MTDVRGGVELTAEAEARLGEYLAGVRAALAGLPGVSPDEIEADVREHVENELRAAPRPVGAAALEAVLARLGPPDQWAAGDRPSALARAGHAVRAGWGRLRAGLGGRWRAAREAVAGGPDDARLAYLTFGVFALGVVTVIGFPVCLVVSYLLARAGVAAAREKGVELGASRKWLLYPPAVVVSTGLLLSLAGPPVAAGAWAGDEVSRAASRVAEFDRPDPVPLDGRGLRDWREREARRERMARQVEEDRRLLAAVPAEPRWAPAAAGVFAGGGAAALLGLVLGVVGATWPGAVRGVFFPLAERFRSWHGWVLAVGCTVVLAAWSVAVYEAARAW
jgi:hypothetical protein